VKFGVIGYGSIGQRHVRNLLSLGYEDIVLLRNTGSGNEHDLTEFSDMQAFLDAHPDTVIISNPTSLHAEYVTQVLAQDIHVMVEKPLVATLEEWHSLQVQLENYNGIGMTAYNMRFHPCVRETHQILSSKKLGKIYSSRFFVGQYLPDWHPGTDYSKSYSASSQMGGGVVFDLIHEIDLACYLVGEPVGPVACQVDRVSDLQIDTEDLTELLYRTENKSFVSIHLDYLTRCYQRYIEIVGERGSLRVDLFSNKVTVVSESGKAEEKFFPEFSRNDMYLNMLSRFTSCLEEKNPPPISLQEGLLSNRIAIDIRSNFYANA
jgi:predicted dehydrogenase